MSTQKQIAANQSNSQRSTGPRSAEGKAAASQNNLRHGFTGEFRLLAWEDPSAYHQLLLSFVTQYTPADFAEQILVEGMAQHHWLTQRALELQNRCFESESKSDTDIERSLALYLRYQTTHQRAFHKCLQDLSKSRTAKTREQIGFESQQAKLERQARLQAGELRKQELHKFKVWLGEAKAEHQELLNHRLETPEMRVPNRLERLVARAQAA